MKETLNDCEARKIYTLLLSAISLMHKMLAKFAGAGYPLCYLFLLNLQALL